MADLIDRDASIQMLSCYAETQQDLDYYRDMLMKIPAVNRWIPVEDALPESLTNRVLVYCIGDNGNGFVGFGHYEKYNGKDLWFSLQSDRTFEHFGWTVTHWMPLPEPPEKE